MFQLNEIIFNGQPSVLINIREIGQAPTSLTNDMPKNEQVVPYSSVQASIKVISLVCSQLENDSLHSEALQKIQDAAKLADLKI